MPSSGPSLLKGYQDCSYGRGSLTKRIDPYPTPVIENISGKEPRRRGTGYDAQPRSRQRSSSGHATALQALATRATTPTTTATATPTAAVAATASSTPSVMNGRGRCPPQLLQLRDGKRLCCKRPIGVAAKHPIPGVIPNDGVAIPIEMKLWPLAFLHRR